MKTKIVLSAILALLISGIFIFNSAQTATAGQKENLDINTGSINAYVTYANGACENIFVQIKTLSGTVVLQGYTAFNKSGENVVSWISGLPPAGNYNAVAYDNGTSSSTQFYWNGSGSQPVTVHFSFYANCGDE